MSVQIELTRILTARNDLRTKAIALGIGTATDSLTQLATKYGAIVDRGTPAAEVQEGQAYTIQPGYYHGGTVTGVAGGGSYTLQAKGPITPTKSQQTVSPDSGYYGLSSVIIGAIPDNYHDVSSVTAVAAHVLAGDVFVENDGVVQTGTMQNRGAVTQVLDTEASAMTIAEGYHNGSGSVSISLQNKTCTPAVTAQTISPDSGKVLAQVVVGAIPGKYGDATNKTVSAPYLLNGLTAIGWDSEDAVAVNITGTMANNGAVSPAALAAGASYTIPAGYHNGNGVVTAQSLAAQTGVDTGKTAIAAAYVLTGYQGWVNGEKVTGAMVNNGAVSGTITGLGSVSGDTSFTIPAGFTTGGTVSLTNDIETALAAI